MIGSNGGTLNAEGPTIADFGLTDNVPATVTFPPELFNVNPTTDTLPYAADQHIQSCCCPGCGGTGPQDPTPTTALFAEDDGGTLGGAVSAPSQLSDLADFLTTDFWTNFGTVPREFNLTGSGLNPKNGVLHYNVTGFSNAGGAGTDTNGLTTARADLVRDVLDVFSEVLGISFVETTSSSTSFTDLFFKDTDAGSAYANSAGYSAGIQYSWINVSQDWSGGTSTYNDYTLQTIFHEVGHALGLGHQGLYNGSGSYATDSDFENDSWQATMMSYFSQNENTTIPASFAFLQTPMAVDWIALQDIYGDQSYGGVDFGVGNAFLGDTVYGFNTNISSETSNVWAEFASYADRTASTIIDAGGIDTLDFSGYWANQLINLTPTSQFDTAPSISNIGGRTGNLTLGEGTVIENAIGGSGADTFIGNDADNIFTGNAGNDLFNDSQGSDRYFGGAGTDTVDFMGLFSSYSFSIAGTFLAVVNAATDFVENTIEFLSFDDQVLGFQDILDGLGGNSAPTATNDTAQTSAGDVLSGSSLLGNDSDPDGDALTVASVNGAAANVGEEITLASGATLRVNADGTFEYDPNGAFDGLSSSESATDSFAYTASDGSDGSNTATVTITVNGVNAPPPTGPVGQSGVATVSQSGPDQWHSISFAATIQDAVVVMGPATSFDAAPFTTRLRNITETGFEFQIDEWDYLDGVHGTASIGWLAVAQGTHQLSSGETIVAATTSVGTDYTTVSFGETLTDAVVLSDVASVNEEDAVTTRMRDVSDQGFDVRLQEEEAGGDHITETVSWIAIEAGLNSDFNAFLTPDEVRDAPAGYAFESTFATTPVVLADMQTADGEDTSVTRLSSVDSDGVSLFIEEEQSRDNETGHTTESVGVVALKGGLLFVDPQPNTGPVAQDDTATVAEGATLSINVLANDTDADGDLLQVREVAGQTISVGATLTLASGAQVTLNTDQSLTYFQNGAFDALNTGQSAQDQFSYRVADPDGALSTADVTVTIAGADAPQPTGAIGQSGTATVIQSDADQWHSVSFDTLIENAVVVLGPVSSNDSDALTTRVRNVTDTGFEFQIDEWDYLDGIHASESVGWLAMAEGAHTLASGQTIVAGAGSVGTSFEALAFGDTLTDAVVFAEVTSVNETDAVTTRIRNVSNQGFEVQIEEQESGGDHNAETVSWIAVEASTARGFDAMRLETGVNQNGDSFEFNLGFAESPVLIADMQSTNGGDTATLRLGGLEPGGATVFVQEEQSANAEVSHANEAVGYLALEEGLIYLDTFLI